MSRFTQEYIGISFLMQVVCYGRHTSGSITHEECKMIEGCWRAAMAAVKVQDLSTPSGVEKARWQDKDLKGIVSRNLWEAATELEKSMVFQDNLLQTKERCRKANDQVVPTELLSTQLTRTSLYGFVASSYTCLVFCRPKNSSFALLPGQCSTPLMALVHLLFQILLYLF